MHDTAAQHGLLHTSTQCSHSCTQCSQLSTHAVVISHDTEGLSARARTQYNGIVLIICMFSDLIKLFVNLRSNNCVDNKNIAELEILECVVLYLLPT